MTDPWLALVGTLVGAAIALAALLVAVRSRAGARREVAAARAEAEALRRRLDALEEQAVARPEPAYVATVLDGRGDRTLEAPPIGAPAFADLVLRESVIRLASLGHGVRRALSPEQRNRIRFEMGREVKRSRRDRRDEMKAALREYQARQRADREDAA